MSLRTVDEIVRAMEARAEEEEPPEEIEDAGKALEAYPASSRPAPSSLLRSALFSIAPRSKRTLLEGVEIAGWKGVSIKYTGPHLRQNDLDMWIAVTTLWRLNGRPEIMEINLRELLRLAGRKGGNTQQVWRDVVRLAATAVELRTDRMRYVGSLVDEAVFDEDAGRYIVRINPRLAILFGVDATHLDIEMRCELKSDLAKWLQGYVCSHKASAHRPHKIGLDKLQPLTGSVSPRRNFRIALRRAMEQCAEVGLVSEWSLEEDVLTFIR